MSLIPKLVPFDVAEVEGSIKSRASTKRDLSDKRPSANGRYKLQPNSVYFLRFKLQGDGLISVAHDWWNQGVADWEHEDWTSMPTGSNRPKKIPPGSLNQLTEDYLDGRLPANQLTRLPSTGANFSWRWISWVVVTFDHPNWQFDSGRNPVLISTHGNANHSYFEGKHVGTGGRKNAFAFVNLMSADSNGSALPGGAALRHKFDLVMSVKLADGTSLRVLVDPTGTNNGPGGGGAP